MHANHTDPSAGVTASWVCRGGPTLHLRKTRVFIVMGAVTRH